MNDNSWKAIFDAYKIQQHNFDKAPFIISAEQIKGVQKRFVPPIFLDTQGCSS